MLAKITLYDGTVYKIASATTDTQDGIYLGRIKDELQLVSQMQEAGNAPTTVNLTIINHDNFIPRTKDLWAAELLLTNDNDVSWRGKINFCNFDADGNLYVTASEKTAPELELQLPDEVRQVYTVDEDFHQSSVTMTIPLVIGGTTSNPITLPTILIDKTRGIYLICVGEIRSIVKVYNGAEQLPQTAYTAYTGTADQQENAGFAYVQIAEDYRLNSDGSYAEINVDVVGLKLGNHTEAECRNGARFLYYFLTTADTGINGWGCGIDSNLIDTASFNSAITLCDQLGYKLDGIMWLRQSAQSWIDQICQAIHGKYSINANGKRSLFIDYAGNASKKTFTASNMQVERYGKNSYTSVVYNKGVLSYDYNPITGLFMQSAQYENSDSIAQIGEQKFIGESYLIKDATTALAVLEYTCKRSQIAAEAIEFNTDAVETNLRAGDIITINRPDLNLNNALYQIQSISTTDFISNIIAVKFDTSVFIVSGTPSSVNWGSEKAITPALTPAQATNLLLSTGFDINPDGTGTPYISGTFTVPEGGWLAAAVQYGIGASPSNWTELALITEGRFKLSPVNVGTVYSIRIRMITATGHSSYLTGQITATGDTIPPSEPTISAKATDRTVTVQCGLDNPPYDMGGFQIYRKKSTEQVYTLIGSVAANRGYASFTDYVDEYVTYNYQAKSYDRSGNLSTNFSNVASVTVTGIQANDVAASAIAMPTGSILRLSAKNCTTASIAETNGVKDVSGRGNHGQAYGGVEVVKDNDLGDCYSFDGTNDYISVDAMKTRLNGAKGATLLAKIYFESVSAQQGIVVGTTNTSAVGFGLVFHSDTKKLRSAYIINTGDSASHIDSEKNFETGKWYDIAASVDFEHGINSLYINGVLDAQSTTGATGTLSYDFHSFTIGRQGTSYPFSGKIFGVRVYPRALTASEIKTIYMFPDDVTFGQLTADLIGTNVIKASNLVLTENIITTNAQIKQAVIDNLTLTGNANFTGLSNKVTQNYGTCSTAAATAAKVVTLSNFVLYTGAQISVKFTNSNTIANPTLNVNSTGAKTIYAKGAALTASSQYAWAAGDTVSFVYNGSQWEMQDISLASNIYSTNTTTINGGKITTGTITAAAIAANAITADKITVKSMSVPSGEKFHFNLQATNDFSMIPDSSGQGNFSTMVGSIGIDQSSNPTIGRYTNFAPTTNRYYNTSYKPMNGAASNVTLATWLAFDKPSASSSQWILFLGQHGSYAGWGIGIFQQNLYAIYRHNTGDTLIPVNLNYTWRNWVHIALSISVSGSTITLKAYKNGVLIKSESATVSGTFDITSTLKLGYPIFIGGSGNASIPSAIRFADTRVFNRALSDTEIQTLYVLGTDTESGQITADRIATDAIKSRNFSGSTDGSAFSTQGSFLDLANGNFITPFYRLKSSSSNKECQIGAWTIKANGAFEADSWATGTSVSEKPVITVKGTFAGGLSYTELNHFCYSAYAFYDPSGRYQDKTYVYLTPRGLTFERGDPPSGTVKFGIGEVDVVNPTTGSSTRWGLYVTGNAYCTNGTWTSCDENVKRDIKDVSTLAKLKEIRVKKFKYSQKAIQEKEWLGKQALIEKENAKKGIKTEEEKMPEFKDDENAPDYIMAMAGEFNKAFGVDNGNEESINYTNAIGVALRSIQELAEIVDSQKAEIAELKALLKNQQDEKSDVEQESSYTEKSNNSKDADNLDFPDVGKIQKINKKDKSNEKTINTAVSASDSSNN